MYPTLPAGLRDLFLSSLKCRQSLFKFIGLKWRELSHIYAVFAICNPWTDSHPAALFKPWKGQALAPSVFIIKSFLCGFTVEKEAVTLHLISSKTPCCNLLKRLLMQGSFSQGVFRQTMLFLKQRAEYPFAADSNCWLSSLSTAWSNENWERSEGICAQPNLSHMHAKPSWNQSWGRTAV